MRPLEVLVTDGDNRATLALVRSLGSRHRVTVVAARHPSLASASRFCHARLTLPDPSHSETEFVEGLLREVKRRRIDVLIPVTDIATFVVVERRVEFESHCRLPLPATDALRTAANKAATLALAAQLGLAVPRTRVIERTQDRGRGLAVDETYPLIVKPARSRIRNAPGWGSTAVRFAADPRAFAQILADLPREAYPILVQERIQGPGIGVFACYDRGRCVALFSHRRVREKPPSGGVSVLCESAPLDAVAMEAATRLLDHLRWHGVAMVEFKRDERDGQPKLMEINGRFWGSLQLAVDAGVDFPALVTQLDGADAIAEQADYRIGVRSRWLWGDVDALLTVLFNRAERAKLPAAQRSRRAALEAFTRDFFDPRTRQEIMRANDRGPGWLELRRWLLRR